MLINSYCTPLPFASVNVTTSPAFKAFNNKKVGLVLLINLNDTTLLAVVVLAFPESNILNSPELGVLVENSVN